MREQSLASPDDIDLTKLGAMLRRAAPRLIALSVAAGLVTYATLSMMAPRYASQAELAIVAKGAANPFANPNNPVSGLDTLPSRMDKEAVNTHVRSMLSSNLAAKVARELQLDQYKEFNPALGPVDTFSAALQAMGLGGGLPGISQEDAVLNEFFGHLDVYSPAESRVINVRFMSIDPDLAARVANTLAETYRQELASATVAETDTVQRSLAPKINELSDELSKAEAEVASFRAKAGLLRGGAQQIPINEQQLGDVASELTKASAVTTAAETRARAARQLLTSGTPEVIPEVQVSPTIQNLIQQRVAVDRDLLKLSATMKSAHPVIRQLNADLGAVKQQIAIEVNNLVAGLDREAFIAAEQEAAIRKSLEAVKNQVADSGPDGVELRRLEAKAAAKRGELERLSAQYEANRARADGGVVPVEAQIITLARPSSVPVFPRKGPYTILLMVGTLLLGTAAVITSGLATGARRMNSDELLLRGDIAVVAASVPPLDPDPAPLPPSPRTRGDPALPDGPDLNPELAPAFRSPAALGAHMMHNATLVQNGLRTMLASVADPATTADIALRTAAAMTDAGFHTLLIDGNIDGRGLASEFELVRSPGLAELLDGTAKFPDVVRRLPDSNVHIIASGAASAEGTRGLDADQLNMILDALDEAYDQIVVVAALAPARVLFETIQGRFDLGVVIEPAGTAPHQSSAAPYTFLGFAVTDIELLRFEVDAQSTAGAPGTRAKMTAA